MPGKAKKIHAITKVDSWKINHNENTTPSSFKGGDFKKTITTQKHFDVSFDICFHGFNHYFSLIILLLQTIPLK